MSSDAITDAIVVGAGPVGMTLAAELARYGLGVRIFDKRAHTVAHSHALTVHVRTQEVLAAMGIAQQWRDRGYPFNEMSFHAFGKHLGTVRLAGVDGDPVSGPIDIGQNFTEAMLVDHLATLGVQVERPVEVISVADHGEQASIVVTHQDGREETVSASYVLGCEGSNSLVRKSADIPFEGKVNAGIEFLQTDAVVRCAYPPGRGNLFVTADRLIGMFPMDGAGLYRVLCARPDKNPQDRSDPTLAEMEQIVREIVDPQAVLSDPIWLNRFRTQHRVAARFRAGPRSFIVGDAAHVHVPVAGQGMNTGMQDAFNLAWKLAYVHKGWAHESLLDTYDDERRPNAEKLIKFTDAGFRTFVQPGRVSGTVLSRAGPTLLGLSRVQEKFRSKIAAIDINYRGSRLSQQAGGSAGPRAGDRLPDARLVNARGRTETRLHEAVTGCHWTLLVLADGGIAIPNAVLRTARGYGERLRLVLVTRDHASVAQADLNHDVLLDPDGEAHARLAARKPCAILVRPDWYIGYRGTLGDERNLAAYLARVIVPVASASGAAG